MHGRGLNTHQYIVRRLYGTQESPLSVLGEYPSTVKLTHPVRVPSSPLGRSPEGVKFGPIVGERLVVYGDAKKRKNMLLLSFLFIPSHSGLSP